MAVSYDCSQRLLAFFPFSVTGNWTLRTLFFQKGPNFTSTDSGGLIATYRIHIWRKQLMCRWKFSGVAAPLRNALSTTTHHNRQTDSLGATMEMPCSHILNARKTDVKKKTAHTPEKALLPIVLHSCVNESAPLPFSDQNVCSWHNSRRTSSKTWLTRGRERESAEDWD